MAEIVRRFSGSVEFLHRGYGPEPALLALYRGAPSREPGRAGYDGQLRDLRVGVPGPSRSGGRARTWQKAPPAAGGTV